MLPFNHFTIQPCGIAQAGINAICTLLRIPNYPSTLEINRDIWCIMGWGEVIKPTSHNAPVCANSGHSCLTQLASCQSTFNGVQRHACIQLSLVLILWHWGSSRIVDLGTVNVTSSLEPRLRFATQASPNSNTKHCANSNLRCTVGLKDSDEKKRLFSKLHIYLLVCSHTGSTGFLPSESFLEMSMSDTARLTELVLQSSEHTIKPPTPAAQKATNIP
ncbi:hypothetical protein O181_110419 [Austropuccinia psidii MF-1]|uniref:Uncharacterized protein n=1 Tax=Austropuccinia psidii MF-1 TaxID=1389203 RepID=A0A9Q3JY96_9BASI|nr:hypothetical protein [Austropuccinia psidii MF-1]